MPYPVAPYSFVHPHHSIPTFGGPMPSHRLTLPVPSVPPHMYHAAFPPHPGHPQHPQHPHHPSQPTQPPSLAQYYTPQPPPLPGTHHLFTMQQPMPVNVGVLVLLYFFSASSNISVRTRFRCFQVQAGVTGPIPGQNNMPGSALVQAQPMISTVRAQPQVIKAMR